MFRRILVSIAAIIGIGLALWFSVLLFFGLLVIFVIGYGLYFGRDFLIAKGILNPQPGVPLQETMEEDITVIEGDFERIDEEKKP